MKATQCVAPGEVRFIETPKPLLKSGHALVKPLLISLCGSDVHMVYYEEPHTYPRELGTSGHEMIGVVEAVDAPGSGIQPGDVALTLAPAHGAMAECYLAPIEHVLVLPPGKPLEHLLMAQQLGTVIYAGKRLPNLLGKDVAIIGQGSAGLLFAAMCRRMGAERVITLDLMEARVAVSPQFGATHAINNAQEDALAAVEEITRGRLVDVVVEAAGEIDSINLAPRLVKIGGHLLYFGIPRITEFRFDFAGFFRKYCYTTSLAGAPSEPGCASFRAALRLVASGEIDVTPLLTHRFKFAQVPQAYELAKTRADGVIKIVVEMPAF